MEIEEEILRDKVKEVAKANIRNSPIAILSVVELIQKREREYV